MQIPPLPGVIAFRRFENVLYAKALKVLIERAIDVNQRILKSTPQIKLWKRLSFFLVLCRKEEEIVLAACKVEGAFNLIAKDASPFFEVIYSALAGNVQRTRK